MRRPLRTAPLEGLGNRIEPTGLVERQAFGHRDAEGALVEIGAASAGAA